MSSSRSLRPRKGQTPVTTVDSRLVVQHEHQLPEPTNLNDVAQHSVASITQFTSMFVWGALSGTNPLLRAGPLVTETPPLRRSPWSHPSHPAGHHRHRVLHPSLRSLWVPHKCPHQSISRSVNLQNFLASKTLIELECRRIFLRYHRGHPLRSRRALGRDEPVDRVSVVRRHFGFGICDRVSVSTSQNGVFHQPHAH